MKLFGSNTVKCVHCEESPAEEENVNQDEEAFTLMQGRKLSKIKSDHPDDANDRDGKTLRKYQIPPRILEEPQLCLVCGRPFADQGLHALHGNASLMLCARPMGTVEHRRWCGQYVRRHCGHLVTGQFDRCWTANASDFFLQPSYTRAFYRQSYRAPPPHLRRGVEGSGGQAPVTGPLVTADEFQELTNSAPRAAEDDEASSEPSDRMSENDDDEENPDSGPRTWEEENLDAGAPT